MSSLQFGDLAPLALPRDELESISSVFKKPDVRSTKYDHDVDCIREYGEANSTVRSAYETQTALFWSYGPGK